MRVAFITTSYPADGDDPRGIHVHRLAVALVALGNEVSVVSPSPRVTPYELDGITVTPVAQRAAQPGHLATGISGIMPNLRRRPWLAIEVLGLLSGLKRGIQQFASDCDIVHAHWLLPTSWAVARWGNAYQPVVTTCHGGDVNLLRWMPPLKRAARQAIERSAFVVGVSEAMTEELRALSDDTVATETIPIGVPDPGIEGRQRGGSAGNNEALRILYVGGLSKRKSVATLLEAFESLDRKGAARLKIAGDGPTGPHLRKQTRRLGLQHVELLGAVPPRQVVDLMQWADVLVLPSLSEGKPTVLMEAMALGVVIVASDIAGTRELVNSGVNGLLFQPRDWRQLEHHLLQLHADRSLLRQLSDGSRASAPRYSVSNVAAAYERIYSLVLSGDRQ